MMDDPLNAFTEVCVLLTPSISVQAASSLLSGKQFYHNYLCHQGSFIPKHQETYCIALKLGHVYIIINMHVHMRAHFLGIIMYLPMQQ